MQFTSVFYLLFFAVVAALYFLAPARLQNAVLLAASLFYYGLNLPHGESVPLYKTILPAAVQIFSLFCTYFVALSAEKKQSSARKRTTAVGVCLLIAVLCFFKYANFVIPTLLGATVFPRLALPLGLSFYSFASIGYLVDVCRGKAKAEHSFVRLAVFVTFFGTITSGPICRAGQLLPQLAVFHRFDYRRTTDGLRLALVGYFKQIAIANVLGLSLNIIFNDVHLWSGLILTFGAIFYAFQLYFEFSGYSDIAQASGMILGIDLPKNFDTPYFSTNFSGFWSRWHISLSAWLQEYLFLTLVWSGWQTRLPVVGKRWQSPPVLTSLFLTFLVSGLWHGNTLPYLVWGLLQGAYRIGEELLHKYYRKPKKRPPLSVRCGKTLAVFALWSASLVFFRIGLVKDAGVSDGFYLLVAQFQNISLSRFAADLIQVVSSGFYNKPVMVAGYLLFIFVVLAIGIYMDWYQCFRLKKEHISTVIVRWRPAVRYLVYWGLAALILVGFIMQSGGYGSGVGFAYANF